MKRKLKHYTKLLKEGKIELSDVQRSIAGWSGYVNHANSYSLRKSMKMGSCFFLIFNIVKYRVLGNNYMAI